MGKGSSGIGSGGSGGKGATRVTDNNGGIIDLSGSPLVYGKNDSGLDGRRRTAVEGFESRYINAKIENGATFDADGNITEQKRGGKGSVKTSIAKMAAADTFSHNHPRHDGVLGGTFSEADLNNFTTFNVKTFRAAAKEGTYSISKGKNFDAAGFRRWYQKEFAPIKAGSSAAISALNKKWSTMPYETYTKQYNAESNKMLVQLHNKLIEGQKAFGYTCTLERRK